MSVVASGPPFVSRNLCKCGWMWEDECKKTEGCGLKNGMPEYKDMPSPKDSSGDCGMTGQSSHKIDEFIKPNNPLWGHTPYEFLHEMAYKAAAYSPPAPQIVDLNKVCREVVEGLVKDSKSTQVGGTHYAEMEVQPWDAMRAWMSPEEYAAYHIGTVIGYLARHKKKGGLQDIKKSHHHLSELIRYFNEEEEYPW